MKKYIWLLILLLTVVQLNAQETYKITIPNSKQEPRTGHLNFSGVNPEGTTLDVNSRYFIKDNKPWFPVMGEFHYIRFPEQYWEEQIIKMKSGGLSIVATYIFWNAHENPKETWNWEGIRDLRKFVELCQKHEMYVWLRIGPWSHGEQLHGGHPDWVNKMRGKRSNNPKYLKESEKLFKQIGEQVKGQFFKDGGPIIGVQLENEYASGDINHIGTLKEMALKAGIDPVYFTTTANTVFHDDKCEAIPLQGGYPYRGWAKGGGKATKDFLYANDQWIMTDALGKVYYDISQYPKGMCEQGCGSQITYKNRFTVEPHVIEAHLQNQIGRGMNLVGYYMFQGGTQLPGLKEPGYPESYDFQSPLSEFGEIRTSYKYLKILHNFIGDFGRDLATMKVVEPKNPVRDELNTNQLRYIVRASENSGFLFLNNTQVRVPMPDKTFKMKLELDGEIVEFPRKLMTLKGEKTAILPFNLNVNGASLKYATVQPVCRISKAGEQFLFFTEVEEMDVELAFETASIQTISAKGWKKETDSNLIYLTPEIGSEIKITASNGQKSILVILTREQAENCWRTVIDGQESVIITNADLLSSKGKMELRQLDNSDFEFQISPKPTKEFSVDKEALQSVQNGIFSSYSIKTPSTKSELKITELPSEKVSVQLPENLPANLSDIFLKIEYLGGSADVFLNDKKVTDHLFHGPSWLFGTKRYINEGGNLSFTVNPWRNSITGVDKELVERIRESNQNILSILVKPQY